MRKFSNIRKALSARFIIVRIFAIYILIIAIIHAGCSTCGSDDDVGEGKFDDDDSDDDLGDDDDGDDDLDDDEDFCVDDTRGSDEVWIDESSGLMWQVDPSCDVQSIYNSDICLGIEFAGFDDWRLPSISELRTLVRGCPAMETGGACGVTDDCTEWECWSESCIGCESGNGPDGGCYGPVEISDYCWSFWSASKDDEYQQWVLWFDNGGVSLAELDYDFNALTVCVRDVQDE